MINLVLQTIPSYEMFVFLILKTLCDEINATMAVLVVKWGEGTRYLVAGFILK